MLTTYRQAYKTLVYANLGEGHEKLPVGFFLDFVINPDDGVVEALWIQTLQGKRCLDPHDIVHWRSTEILIRDPENCYEPETEPKLKKIFKKECVILGAPVYSRRGNKRLGQVRDFGFDTISPRLLSLHVRTRWWRPWTHQIIPHQRIHKITENGIAINNENTIKATPKVEKVKEAIKSVEEVPKVDCDE